VNHYDPTDLKGQEISREEEAARQRLANEVEQADLKWLMSSKKGRRIVWRLLEQSRVFESVYDPVAMKMAHNEGHRNYGLLILKQLMRVHLELFFAMMREGQDANRNDDGNGTNN
jgi:hypothetical protein